ncbi:helix-turn-helix domain-containing protein [Silvimonas iriomotensis]|uniref:Winged helix-turn-helix domain-containing protein n=1 Tax=Silvimonas iriomotensis TaxID=449662 RepID=A0ABQ2P4Q7_9NEIS|nr:helix-turn-helix domain-containing protein [Silvimonas iriomotensis]GGP18150.1 hypothetical protein GCM10010970_03430 [Silvimonas iriomotensis]
MKKKNRHPNFPNSGQKELFGHDTAGAASDEPPTVTGQAAIVLELIRNGPVTSLQLIVDYTITNASTRITELRRMGFNIETNILKSVTFRGRIRSGIASYTLGKPEWLLPDPK